MKFNINQTKQFHGSALPNRVKFKTRRDSYHHICILSEMKKKLFLSLIVALLFRGKFALETDYRIEQR